MRRSLHHLILIALLAAPAAARAAEPYEGRWTEEPAWCGNTRRNGDEIPIIITRHSIEQFASLCRVQSVRRRGAAWWLDTFCRDEGEDTKQRIPNRFELRVDGDKLSMRDGAGVRNFTRCPP
jgi:hypothetical protein